MTEITINFEGREYKPTILGYGNKQFTVFATDATRSIIDNTINDMAEKHADKMLADLLAKKILSLLQ